MRAQHRACKERGDQGSLHLAAIDRVVQVDRALKDNLTEKVRQDVDQKHENEQEVPCLHRPCSSVADASLLRRVLAFLPWFLLLGPSPTPEKPFLVFAVFYFLRR